MTICVRNWNEIRVNHFKPFSSMHLQFLFCHINFSWAPPIFYIHLGHEKPKQPRNQIVIFFFLFPPPFTLSSFHQLHELDIFLLCIIFHLVVLLSTRNYKETKNIVFFFIHPFIFCWFKNLKIYYNFIFSFKAM